MFTLLGSRLEWMCNKQLIVAHGKDIPIVSLKNLSFSSTKAQVEVNKLKFMPLNVKSKKVMDFFFFNFHQ